MRVKKNIFVNLLNFVSPQIAGTGVFTKNLFQLWLPQLNRETSITIMYSSFIDVRDVFGIPQRPQIKLIPIRSKNFIGRIFFEQLVLPFFLRKYDVYFSPTPVLPFISKIISPRVKLIITIHDMIPFFIPKKYGVLRTLYIKYLSKYGAKVADKIVTVSENSKKDICAIAKIKPHNVKIVYNFNVSTIDKSVINYRPYFLSISTIEPGKNIEHTLQGFKLFLEQNPKTDYKFYWIGKVGWGYTIEGLNKMIRTLALSNNFFLLGYVDDNKKTELLSNCTALVYLSHYEGFGLGVLEGLNFSKPAVVSNTSALPEVIGKAGVICNKEDAADIAKALTEITINLDYYVNQIPNQLERFDGNAQLQKFIEIVEIT
jgi:glycosyltransferase involved in cell wall biosynthesis